MPDRSLFDRHKFHNVKGISEFTNHFLSMKVMTSMQWSCNQLNGVKDRHVLFQDYLKLMLFSILKFCAIHLATDSVLEQV